MTDQAGWEKTIGLAAGTTQVAITCNKEDWATWSEEADEQGYTSRSKYLYHLIQEARAFGSRCS